MRQAPQEVVSEGGPTASLDRAPELRCQLPVPPALRRHRWGPRPKGFEMAAVPTVHPGRVGEWRVGRSAPQPIGADGCALYRRLRGRLRCALGHGALEFIQLVVVWWAPHWPYSARSTRMAKVLSCLTLGSTARRRSESMARWESLGHWAFRRERVFPGLLLAGAPRRGEPLRVAAGPSPTPRIRLRPSLLNSRPQEEARLGPTGTSGAGLSLNLSSPAPE